MRRITPAVALLVAIGVPACTTDAQATTAAVRPRDHAGLYRIEPPTAQRDRAFDVMKEFAWFRLEPDGRVRMETVAMDVAGAQVTPRTTVGAWSAERWSVQPATATAPARFCLPAPPPGAADAARGAASAPEPKAACLPYQRDARSGDLVLAMGRNQLTLRRVVR